MSVFVGTRLLRGAPGSKVTLTIIRGNAAEPHTVDLIREALAPMASSQPPGAAGHRPRPAAVVLADRPAPI